MGSLIFGTTLYSINNKCIKFGVCKFEKFVGIYQLKGGWQYIVLLFKDVKILPANRIRVYQLLID